MADLAKISWRFGEAVTAEMGDPFSEDKHIKTLWNLVKLGVGEWCQPQTPSGNLDDLDDLMFLIIWEYNT